MRNFIKTIIGIFIFIIIPMGYLWLEIGWKGPAFLGCVAAIGALANWCGNDD